MKTEAEIRAAMEAFTWYMAGPKGDGKGQYLKQNQETQANLVGVLACLDWLTGGSNNPIAKTLKDIARMRLQKVQPDLLPHHIKVLRQFLAENQHHIANVKVEQVNGEETTLMDVAAVDDFTDWCVAKGHIRPDMAEAMKTALTTHIHQSTTDSHN